MNQKTRKKILIAGLIVIALCLASAVGIMFANRSVKREPTAEEIQVCAPYAVNWQESLGAEGTDRELILSLCTPNGEKTIGNNQFAVFTSETIGKYLYNFREILEIAQLDGNILYVQYTTTDGGMVTLGYDESGLNEKTVYDAAADTLYAETKTTKEVWSNFRHGFQWGDK